MNDLERILNGEVTEFTDLLNVEPQGREGTNALKREQYRRLANQKNALWEERNVKVFFLRHYAGLKFRVIGELLGLKAGRAGDIYYRARMLLLGARPDWKWVR